MDPIASTAYARLAGVDPPKIDPRTGKEEERHRIGVVSRPTHQMLPGGHIVERSTGLGKDGQPEDEGRWNFLIVYSSDLDKLRDLVEMATETELRDVEREYERRVASWLKAVPDGDVASECPHSRESAFAHVMGREMRPIVELEVFDAKTTKKAA